jgi:hypothetical protein
MRIPRPLPLRPYWNETLGVCRSAGPARPDLMTCGAAMLVERAGARSVGLSTQEPGLRFVGDGGAA